MPKCSSADIARDELTDGAMWEKTYDMCKSFKEKIVDTGIKVLENDDMTRLVLNFSNLGITGFDVDDILLNNGIDKITNNTPKVKSTLNLTPPPICKEKLFPQKAFFSNQRDTKLQNSIGHISCSTVVPYPPGVPVIYTGETIRKEQIDYIEYLETKGAEITGISNGTIAVSEQNNE